MNQPDDKIIRAHSHCAIHEAEIARSELCGCFHCLAIFEPGEIQDWIDDCSVDDRSGKTALCPKCGIDAVIGSAAGYPVKLALLERMRSYWFT